MIALADRQKHVTDDDLRATSSAQVLRHGARGRAAARRRPRTKPGTGSACERGHIVLLPGDGIGPEVIAAAARVLDAVGRRVRPSLRATTARSSAAPRFARGLPRAAGRHAGGGAGGRRRAARRRRRSGVRSAAAEPSGPKPALLALRQRARRLREPAAGARRGPGLESAGPLKPERARRHRPHRRARADRRPLLRRAARHRRRRRSRRSTRCATRGTRSSASRAWRSSSRARPAQAASSRSTRRTCSRRLAALARASSPRSPRTIPTSR